MRRGVAGDIACHIGMSGKIPYSTQAFDRTGESIGSTSVADAVGSPWL
jgi:hypothetical protein